MRSSFKVLSSVITAVMMVSSFSFLVLADKKIIDQGSVDEPKSRYEWSLDSDGELSVKYGSDPDLKFIGEDNLSKVKAIKADISGNYEKMTLTPSDSGEYLCNATSINLIGNQRIDTFSLDGFPKLEIITSNQNIKRLILTNVGITSLDFIDDLRVDDKMCLLYR